MCQVRSLVHFLQIQTTPAPKSCMQCNDKWTFNEVLPRLQIKCFKFEVPNGVNPFLSIEILVILENRGKKGAFLFCFDDLKSIN